MVKIYMKQVNEIACQAKMIQSVLHLCLPELRKGQTSSKDGLPETENEFEKKFKILLETEKLLFQQLEKHEAVSDKGMRKLQEDIEKVYTDLKLCTAFSFKLYDLWDYQAVGYVLLSYDMHRYCQILYAFYSELQRC